MRPGTAARAGRSRAGRAPAHRGDRGGVPATMVDIDSAPADAHAAPLPNWAGAPSGPAAPLDAIERLDFHLHTYYSACGRRDMVPAAVAAEFRDAGYLAIG